MDATVLTQRYLLLKLTEEEANWLHEYMQNQPENFESAEGAHMRAKFFQATVPFLNKEQT